MGVKENSKSTDKLIFPGSMLSAIQHTLALASLSCVFIFNFPLGLLLHVFPNDTHPLPPAPPRRGCGVKIICKQRPQLGLSELMQNEEVFALSFHYLLICF